MNEKLKKICYRCPHCKHNIITESQYIDTKIEGLKIPEELRIVFECDNCGKEFAVIYGIDYVEFNDER